MRLCISLFMHLAQATCIFDRRKKNTRDAQNSKTLFKSMNSGAYDTKSTRWKSECWTRNGLIAVFHLNNLMSQRENPHSTNLRHQTCFVALPRRKNRCNCTYEFPCILPIISMFRFAMAALFTQRCCSSKSPSATKSDAPARKNTELSFRCSVSDLRLMWRSASYLDAGDSAFAARAMHDVHAKT